MAWSAIIPIIAAIAGSLMGNKGSGDSSGMDLENQRRTAELMNNQMRRMYLQNPLFEETNQLARALLPKSSKPANYHLYNFEGTQVGSTEVGGVPTPTEPEQPQSADALSQAVGMMASGIKPMEQAQLFRRR